MTGKAAIPTDRIMRFREGREGNWTGSTRNSPSSARCQGIPRTTQVREV